MTELQKTNEIAEIDRQLAALEDQIYKSKAEMRKLIEKRDKLNDEFRKLRQEINMLKTERDELNEQVQNLKLMRDETRTKTHSIIEEIHERGQKIAELEKKIPRRSHEELQKEQEDIEWRIQTTSLDLEEEKRLVENVKQLETQLGSYKKIEKQSQKIDELKKELKGLDEKGDGFHKELSAIAQKSQEIHQRMITKIEESKRIKGEADSLHQAYLQTKEKMKTVNAEFRKLLDRRNKLQASLREEDQKKRKNSEQALKEKLESQAKEKLQRGEKLSWEEFQLLADTESRTQN